MLYKYEAMDPTGREIEGEVEAGTHTAAQEAIKKMGYFSTKITAYPCPYENEKVPVDFQSPFYIGLYVGIFVVIALEAIGLLLFRV